MSRGWNAAALCSGNSGDIFFKIYCMRFLSGVLNAPTILFVSKGGKVNEEKVFRQK